MTQNTKYCMFLIGTKRPGARLQSSVEDVAYLETELSSVKTGDTLSVQVVFVENHASFYCQLRPRITAIDQMMNRLDDYCRSLSRDDGRIDRISPGMYCVAKYNEDGGWYRGRVLKQTTHMDCLIHYIDYGNAETVNIRDLRMLHPQFAQLPAQAINCSLSGVSSIDTTAELTQLLMSLTDGNDMKAEVMSICEEKLSVDLIDAKSGVIVNHRLKDLYESNFPVPRVSDRACPKPSTSLPPAIPSSSKKSTFVSSGLFQ